MTDLKECPFCGESETYITEDAEADAVVRCLYCGAMGEPCGLVRDAKKAWNTRADGDGWVSVEDRLPEKSPLSSAQGKQESLLIAFKDGDVIESIYTVLGFANTLTREVTHWRPLPPAPKGKEA